MNETNISLTLLITALFAPTAVSLLGEAIKYFLSIRLNKLEMRNQARIKLHKSCEALLKIAIDADPEKRIYPSYDFQEALHTIAVFGDDESSDYAIEILNGRHSNDVRTISELLSRVHSDIRSSFGLKVKVRSNSIRLERLDSKQSQAPRYVARE